MKARESFSTASLARHFANCNVHHGSENSSSLVISPTFVCYENTSWSFSRNQKYRKSMKTVKLESEFSLKIKKYVSRIGVLLQIQYKIRRIKFSGCVDRMDRGPWTVDRGVDYGSSSPTQETSPPNPRAPKQGMQRNEDQGERERRDGEDPSLSVHVHSVHTGG